MRVARILGGTGPLRERLGAALVEVLAAIPAERAFWVLVDPNGGLLEVIGCSATGEDIGDAAEVVRGPVLEQALLAGGAAKDGSHDVRIGAAMGLTGRGRRARQVLCQPFGRDRELLGVLQVDVAAGKATFTGTHRDLLEVLADLGAGALENARVAREGTHEARVLSSGNLAAGVTHDFNNLLATIIGRAQDLGMIGGSAELEEGLAAIEKAARQAAEVVRRIEDVARRASADEAQAIRLADLVDDVIEYTRFRWEGASLSRGFRTRVMTEGRRDLFVPGPAGEVREMLTALLLVAVDALPEGGEVGIAVGAHDDGVELRITTDGPTPDEQRLRELLDPYGTARAGGGGVGGLATACRVARARGGLLEVGARRSGGMALRLLLPPAEAPQEADAPVARSAPEALQGQRVLVVDDEEGVRDLLSDLLGMVDLQVDVAPDGPSALEVFKRRPARIVLTDLGMDPWSGWDVAEKVKELRPDTIVILITGWAGEVKLETARSRHVDHLLSKPFDIEEVVSTVSGALQRGS